MIDDPAAFQIGSTVYSASRHHADDDSLPLGGVVVEIFDKPADDYTPERWVKTVTSYRGQIVYGTFPVADLQPGQSRGLIRADVLRGLVLELDKDGIKSKDPFKHEDARLAIRHALIGRVAVGL